MEKDQITNTEHYLNFSNTDLITFAIYSILKNKETCTFERLVAECFTKFPKVFSFKRYPQWPDSLKFDRPLRTLRAKGILVGGAGGTYSPGEFQLTEFGIEKAKSIEKALSSGSFSGKKNKKEERPRSVDEKAIKYLKENLLYKKYINNPIDFSATESELRSMLRCTLETPKRIIKQNLIYYKNVAKSYNEVQILNFLELCEKKLLIE